MFPGCLGAGLIQKKNIQIEIIDITQYKTPHNNHKYIDQPPFGGGEGMIICPSVISNIMTNLPAGKRLYMSPRGKVFNQNIGESLAKEEHLIFLCGRYEGVDQRAIDFYDFEELSLGDFILCGGEVAAMTMCEVIIRLQSGTLSNEESVRNESFYNGLLEHDQYTEFREWNGLTVPSVLLEGNHAKIKQWQIINAIEKTKQNRPDLIQIFTLHLCIIFILYLTKDSFMRKFLHGYAKITGSYKSKHILN